MITESIKPAKDKIKIRNLRSTERIIIIETETEQDIDKIMSNKELIKLNLNGVYLLQVIYCFMNTYH